MYQSSNHWTPSVIYFIRSCKNVVIVFISSNKTFVIIVLLESIWESVTLLYMDYTIHILSDISKGKGNHIMKYIRFIEHSLRNIFLRKSCAKCGREASSRPFVKKLKLCIAGSTVWSFMQFVFIVCQDRGLALAFTS